MSWSIDISPQCKVAAARAKSRWTRSHVKTRRNRDLCLLFQALRRISAPKFSSRLASAVIPHLDASAARKCPCLARRAVKKGFKHGQAESARKGIYTVSTSQGWNPKRSKGFFRWMTPTCWFLSQEIFRNDQKFPAYDKILHIYIYIYILHHYIYICVHIVYVVTWQVLGSIQNPAKKKLSDACETPEIKGPPKPWAWRETPAGRARRAFLHRWWLATLQ